MIVFILSTLALIQVKVLHFDLLNSAKPAASYLHHKFVQNLSAQASPYLWLYLALLTNDLPASENEQYTSIKNLGLFHIIIVSGRHLRLLEKGLGVSGRMRPILRPAGLIVMFVSMTLLWLGTETSLPFTRSLVDWCFKRSKKYHRLTVPDRILSTALLLLVLRPSYFTKAGYHLAFLAMIGVFSMDLPQRKQKLSEKLFFTLKVNFVTTLIMSPVLLTFQPCLSWLVVPMNTIAWFFLGDFLLLLSIINSVVPGLRKFTEGALNLMFLVLDYLSAHSQPHFCISVRSIRPWIPWYTIGLVFLWRLLLPFYSRSKFWRQQALRHVRWSFGTRAKGTSFRL